MIIAIKNIDLAKLDLVAMKLNFGVEKYSELRMHLEEVSHRVQLDETLFRYNSANKSDLLLYLSHCGVTSYTME